MLNESGDESICFRKALFKIKIFIGFFKIENKFEAFTYCLQNNFQFILKAEGTVYAMFNASSKVAFNETKL